MWIMDCRLQIVDCIDLCTLAFALCGQLQLSYNLSAGTSELVLVFSSMNTQMHDSYMQSEPMASCSFHIYNSAGTTEHWYLSV